MASPATSARSIVVRDDQGVRIEAPGEWETATLVLPIARSEVTGHQVLINGIHATLRLQRVGRRWRVVSAWPRSGPGTYHVEVRRQGELVSDHTLRVRSSRLDSQAIDALFHDLEEWLPYRIATAAHGLGGLWGSVRILRREATVTQEFLRLRNAVRGSSTLPGLMDVLSRIQHDPHVSLVRVQPWVARDQVRRPSASALVSSLTRSSNVDASGLPIEVLDDRSVRTTDTPENRLVRAYVDVVDVRLRLLDHLLSTQDVHGYRQQVHALRGELDRAVRQVTFLPPSQRDTAVPQRPSTTMMKRPAYRATLKGYLALRRDLVPRMDDSAPEVKVQNLPFLYEVWAAALVLAAVLEAGRDRGFVLQDQRFAVQRLGELVIRISQGQQALAVLVHPVTKMRVTLFYQRQISGTSHGLRSLAFDQVPDLVLEVVRHGGDRAVWILDAKYKLDGSAQQLAALFAAGTGSTGSIRAAGGNLGPVKADIDKMHAYRDAIRDEHGGQVVRFAGVIYPGPLMWYDRFGRREAAAIGAIPGAADAAEDALRVILRDALD